MDSGTKKMKEIAQSINEGAKAFLFSEYKILVIFVATVFQIVNFFIFPKILLPISKKK